MEVSGRTVGRSDGRTVGQSDGLSLGLSDGRTVGQSEGRRGAGSGRLTDRPTDRLIDRPGIVTLALLCLSLAVPASAQDSLPVLERHDSVSIRFVDTDLRAVVQALGRWLPKPVLVAGLPGNRVSLETQGMVSRATVAVLLRGLLESQNLLFQEDSGFIRIGPKPDGQAVGRSVGGTGGTQDTTPVQLYVIRLKHGRAADVAATVNQLFGGSGEFSGRNSLGGSGTLSDELRRQADRPTVRPTDPLTDRPTFRPPALPPPSRAPSPSSPTS